MKAKKISLVLILAFFLINCSSSNIINQKKQKVSDSFYGTYLFISPCQTKLASVKETKGFPLEMAAALASGVVKTGIDWIGSALQKAAQDDVEKTIVCSNLTSISQISNSTNENICLQVVRGSFKYAENGKNNYTNLFTVDPERRVVAPLQVVEGTEELFVEILPIIHDKVVSFTPLEVRYSGYTPSDRHSKKPRDLAIFVGYSLADKDISAGEFSGRLINFGTLTPEGNKQAVIKYVTKDGNLSLINHTQWLSLPDSTKDQLITFAVNVLETRKANQFVKFLATAFESSKDDIKNKADAAVAELEIFKTSKELKNEKLEIEKQKLNNEQAFLEAVATALGKEKDLKTLCESQPPPDEAQIYSAKKDVYIAKKTANLAADAAGENRPYKNSEIKFPDKKCP